MDKTLGKEIAIQSMREQFLKENCDQVEERGYMKPYTKEEISDFKEKLADVSIEIAEVESEAKDVLSTYKGRLKPLKEHRNLLTDNIRKKAEYVREVCYKFVDQEAKMTEWYNKEGDLIDSRMATADELQPTLFQPTLILKQPQEEPDKENRVINA